MSMHRRHAPLAAAWITSLAGILVLGLTLPALADARDISVGGVWVCRITHDSAGYSSYQRAVQVNQRITQVLSTPRFRQGAVVAVKQVGDTATVTVGDVLVFTVTPDDTAGTSVTPVTLARQWAQRLAQGLSQALPTSNFHTF
jgi:hypothetical protein